jgi:hypothetical protein
MARKVFQDVQFHKFVKTFRRPKALRASPPCLKILLKPVSSKLNPTDWLPLHEFLRINGGLTDNEADELYNAFGECVENVRQHAYGQKADRGKWYALAIRPSEGRPARAVIIDTGLGIAKTVRRTPVDLALQFMRALTGKMLQIAYSDSKEETGALAVWDQLAHDDWACLYFATLGLRTESTAKQRGTGLSGLRQAVREMRRGALHVLSGKASITWRSSDNPEREYLIPLEGTTVCLEFGEGSVPMSLDGGAIEA